MLERGFIASFNLCSVNKVYVIQNEALATQLNDTGRADRLTNLKKKDSNNSCYHWQDVIPRGKAGCAN